MRVNVTQLFPWERREAVETLSTPEFLKVEQDLRGLDGHWNWLCDRERARRGLFVPVGRSYDKTVLRAPG